MAQYEPLSYQKVDHVLDYLDLGVLEENELAKKLYLKEGYAFTNQIMRKQLN